MKGKGFGSLDLLSRIGFRMMSENNHLLSHHSANGSAIVHNGLLHIESVHDRLHLLTREVVIHYSCGLCAINGLHSGDITLSSDGRLPDDEVCPRSVVGIERNPVSSFLEDIKLIRLRRRARETVGGSIADVHRWSECLCHHWFSLHRLQRHCHR